MNNVLFNFVEWYYLSIQNISLYSILTLSLLAFFRMLYIFRQDRINVVAVVYGTFTFPILFIIGMFPLINIAGMLLADYQPTMQPIWLFSGLIILSTTLSFLSMVTFIICGWIMADNS